MDRREVLGSVVWVSADKYLLAQLVHTQGAGSHKNLILGARLTASWRHLHGQKP